MKKHLAYSLIYLSLLVSCSQRTATSLKLVFAFDSSKSNALQAAKQATEKFNASTDINGLPLELKILDLGKRPISSEQNLQDYLQKNIGKEALLTGFVLANGSSQRSVELKKILQSSSILYIDNAVSILGNNSENTEQLAYINMTRSAFEKNSYLAKFIREQRPKKYLYIIYAKDYRQKAENFASIMQANGQALRLLEYALGEEATNKQIRSIADFFRDESIPDDSAVVFFFNQERANIINSYLAKSPYQDIFEDLDFYLVGDALYPEDLSNPSVSNYYIFQISDNKSANYQLFREQYQKKYHLKASYNSAEIFDAVCLLAYASKNVLEAPEIEAEELAPALFKAISQISYNGATGPILFNAEGNRVSNHVVIQLADVAPKRLAYYAADKAQFFFE